MFKLLKLLLIASVLGSAVGLVCYHCGNDNDETCDDHCLTNNKPLPCIDRPGLISACMKTVRDNGTIRTQRNCTFVTTKNESTTTTGCSNITNDQFEDDPNVVLVCTCWTDICNESPNTTYNVFRYAGILCLMYVIQIFFSECHH